MKNRLQTLAILAFLMAGQSFLAAQNANADKVAALEIQLTAAQTDGERVRLNVKIAHLLAGKPEGLTFANTAFEIAVKTDSVTLIEPAMVAQFDLLWAMNKKEEAAKKADELANFSEKRAYRKGEMNALREHGTINRSLGANEKAIGFYENALDIAIELGDKANLRLCYSNLGICCLNLGQKDKARSAFEKYRAVCEAENDPSCLANALNCLGELEFSEGNLDKSLEMRINALRIFEEQKDKSRIGSVTGNLGTIYLEQGKYEAAKEQFEKAILVFEELKDNRRLGIHHFNLGDTYNRMALYAQSLSEYLKALAFSEKVDDKSGMAQAYMGISIDKTAQKDYAGALEYGEKGLALSKKIGEKAKVAEISSSMASIYRDQKRFEKAMSLYNESLDIYQSINEQMGIQTSLFEIANTYFYQGDYEKTLEFAQKSLDLGKKIGRTSQLPRPLCLIADAQYEIAKKKLVEAQRAGEESLKVSKGLSENNLHISEAATVLAKIQFALGETNKAEANLKTAAAVKDSVFNLEKIGAITRVEMQSSFDKEKQAEQLAQSQKDLRQQAEIARRNSWVQMLGIGLLSLALLSFAGFSLLRNRQKLQQSRFEQQSTDNSLKALRAQINPHFLFNSLNSIGNFIEKKDPEQARAYLADFAKLMRGTLEQSGQRSIPLSEEMASLRRYLRLESLRFERPFDFEVACAPDVDDFETQIPPMMVQPFVENAVWHGLMPKKRDGHVRIFFEKKDGTLLCTVEDDGVGRNAAATKTEPGHASLGMKITRERFDLLSLQTGKHFDFDVEDLFDQTGLAIGTRSVLSFSEIN